MVLKIDLQKPYACVRSDILYCALDLIGFVNIIFERVTVTSKKYSTRLIANTKLLEPVLSNSSLRLRCPSPRCCSTYIMDLFV